MAGPGDLLKLWNELSRDPQKANTVIVSVIIKSITDSIMKELKRRPVPPKYLAVMVDRGYTIEQATEFYYEVLRSAVTQQEEG